MFFRFLHLLLFVFLLQISYAADLNNASHSDIKQSGKLWGIDISHHQEIISWETIKDQDPNFIFMKATEGSTIQDTKYKQNYKEAREQGFTIGTYHFFSYKSSGRNQAQHFLSVANYKKGDLPLVLDAEFRKNMPPDRLVTMELLSFLDEVKSRADVTPIIYCNHRFYDKYLKKHIGNEYPMWFVDYQKEPDTDYKFWQSTEKFKLPGIKGFVDLNIFSGNHKDLSQLIK